MGVRASAERIGGTGGSRRLEDERRWIRIERVGVKGG